MNITDKAVSKQIMSTFAATGTTAPKAVAAAYERAARLSDATRDLGTPEHALAAAVAAALDAGNDPAADPEVQRILTARQIANQGIMQAVDGLAFDAFRETCREHADEIVKTWRKSFDTAAATLAAAHERIGSTPLEDTHTIMRQGGDIAAAWAEAQAANKTISAATTGCVVLGEFTRLAGNDRRFPALRLAAVDHRTWTAKELERKNLTPWEAVCAGLSLSLPTFEEYRARVQVIERGRQAVTQRSEDDQRRQVRQLSSGAMAS